MKNILIIQRFEGFKPSNLGLASFLANTEKVQLPRKEWSEQ